MSRRARPGGGALCDKLRVELERRGMAVERFLFARGFWASQDVYRWETLGTSKGTDDFAKVPAGMAVRVGGWSTVGVCVRRGFDLSTSDRFPFGHFEASSRGSA